MLTLAACVTYGDGGGRPARCRCLGMLTCLHCRTPERLLEEIARARAMTSKCGPAHPCAISPTGTPSLRQMHGRGSWSPAPRPELFSPIHAPPLWPTHWFPQVLLHIDCACETDSDLLAAVCALRPFGVNLTILGEKRVPTPSFPRVCVCVRSCSMCVDGSCYLCMNAACRGARVSPSSQQNS